MFQLQPDINLSLNRGGSWAVVPSSTAGNSNFVGTDLNDFETATLQGAASFRSSVEISDWVSGTYNTDDYVRYASSIFKCNSDGVTSTPSKTETVDWSWIAYSNKYNMVNGILGSRTYGFSSTNQMFQDWTMTFRSSAQVSEYSTLDGTSLRSTRASKPTQLVMMNLFEVDTVTVEVRASDNTTVISSDSFDVGTYYTAAFPVGWTAYYDLPKNDTNVDEQGQSLVVDISVVPNGYIYVTFAAGADTSMRGVGGVFTGRVAQLGETNYGTGLDITDYSKIEADDFGAYTFVSRSYKNNVSYDFVFDRDNLNAVKQSIVKNRAYPCVYYGLPDLQETFSYGVLDNFNPTITPNKIIATLDIMGV